MELNIETKHTTLSSPSSPQFELTVNCARTVAKWLITRSSELQVQVQALDKNCLSLTRCINGYRGHMPRVNLRWTSIQQPGVPTLLTAP